MFWNTICLSGLCIGIEFEICTGQQYIDYIYDIDKLNPFLLKLKRFIDLRSEIGQRCDADLSVVCAVCVCAFRRGWDAKSEAGYANISICYVWQ